MNDASTLPAESPPKPSALRKWLVRCGVCAAVLAAVWWSRAGLAHAWGDYLNAGRPLTQPVDVVFILGGDLETRPFVAAEIYRAGFVKKVLVSQPQLHSNDFLGGKTEGDLTLEVLDKLGVPEAAIESLPIEVDSTRGEMVSLRKYIAENNIGSVAIVSSDFHTRRICWLVAQESVDNNGQVIVVSAPVDGCRPHDWWRSETGLGVYLLETLKVASVALHLS
ncbi:MAG: YdcF family protein [Planctomycetaceae bacterium]|nr:YdcF family protein [Planctomycetaceae bacterium]